MARQTLSTNLVGRRLMMLGVQEYRAAARDQIGAEPSEETLVAFAQMCVPVWLRDFMGYWGTIVAAWLAEEHLVMEVLFELNGGAGQLARVTTAHREAFRLIPESQALPDEHIVLDPATADEHQRLIDGVTVGDIREAGYDVVAL